MSAESIPTSPTDDSLKSTDDSKLLTSDLVPSTNASASPLTNNSASPSTNDPAPVEEQGSPTDDQPSRWSRILDLMEVLLLILVPAVLALSIIYQFKQTALLSALVAMAAVLPFFLRFEKANVKPRDIMPIVVMVAIAVALRLLLTPLYYVTASSAIVIIAGLGFGKRSGFMTGALLALVSNLFLGQGPWTPWQMYSWGMMGYVSGALANAKFMQKSWQVAAFGGVMSFLYGLILNTYAAFGFFTGQATERTVESVIAVYVAGISYDMAHVASTVVFLLLIFKPWMAKLVRIKTKYGIGA